MGVPQRKSRTEPSIEAAVHGAIDVPVPVARLYKTFNWCKIELLQLEVFLLSIYEKARKGK